MGYKGSTGKTALTAAKSAFTGLALLSAALVAQPAAAAFRYVPPQAAASFTPTGAAPASLLPNQSSVQMPAGGTPTGVVQGFASQVPLTIALRQILPQGTAFKINNDVDTATPVSWRGGKPWQQTLDDMLAGAGLQATYGQNGVTVQRGALAIGNDTAPVVLTPPAATGKFAATDTLAPLSVPTAADSYTPPAIEPAPQAVQPMLQPATETQPYIAPASTGVAAMMPDRNATIGAVQQPVQNTVGAVPEATVGELPQQDVPGTDLGGLPPMQTGALNPLNPGPGDAPLGSVAAPNAEVWEAHSGQSLHEVLVAWASRAGIELNWVSEYDYPIQASLTFSGTFEEATRTLLGGFVNASPQPVGRLHRNEQLGQQALIIETRGNQYDE